MRSAASLHYGEVQEAMDGAPNDRTAALMSDVIRPLYAAYGALKQAGEKRQPLDLDLPERRIELNDEGQVASINFRDRLDAHRLIEEFMILANVCAAETLIAKKRPCCSGCMKSPRPKSWRRCAKPPRRPGSTWPRGRCCKPGI